MKAKTIFAMLMAPLFMVSCYEDYVRDYEYSGVYVAYQYDLRSFVVGEGMEFDVGAVLGGVIKNRSDRTVFVDFDDNLVTGSLSKFWPGSAAFNAYDAMTGKVSYGQVSQSYVTEAVSKAGITGLTPLPEDCYSLSSDSRIVISKGKHTGTVTVKADSTAILKLADFGYRPHYALGYRIKSAQVDTVLYSKSYQVVALRLENMMFGNWYRGGYSVVTDAGGIEEKVEYPTQIPCDENSDMLYKLTTSDALSVLSNRLGSDAGSIRISCLGDELKVSSGSGPEVTDLGSSFNKARLLQDRKLFLNYKYQRNDGSTVVVHDTLTFRNRIRDGVNEWQDLDPSHYKE